MAYCRPLNPECAPMDPVDPVTCPGMEDRRRYVPCDPKCDKEAAPGSILRVANTEFAAGCDPKDCVLCAGIRYQREERWWLGVRPIWILFLILEFIFGLVCIILEWVFEVATIFTRHYGYHYNKRNMRHFLCSARLIYATVYGMPVIVLLLLITILLRKHTTRFSIFPIMFQFLGFVLYLCVGIVTLAFTRHGEKWISLAGKKAFASFAIITAVIYLAHFLYLVIVKPFPPNTGTLHCGAVNCKP